MLAILLVALVLVLEASIRIAAPVAGRALMIRHVPVVVAAVVVANLCWPTSPTCAGRSCYRDQPRHVQALRPQGDERDAPADATVASAIVVVAALGRVLVRIVRAADNCNADVAHDLAEVGPAVAMVAPQISSGLHRLVTPLSPDKDIDHRVARSDVRAKHRCQGLGASDLQYQLCRGMRIALALATPGA